MGSCIFIETPEGLKEEGVLESGRQDVNCSKVFRGWESKADGRPGGGGVLSFHCHP